MGWALVDLDQDRVEYTSENYSDVSREYDNIHESNRDRYDIQEIDLDEFYSDQ